jgi:hypothetical protein
MTPEQLVALLSLLADLRMQITQQAALIAELRERMAGESATAER